MTNMDRLVLYLTMRFSAAIKQIQNLRAYHAGDKLFVEVHAGTLLYVLPCRANCPGNRWTSFSKHTCLLKTAMT